MWKVNYKENSVEMSVIYRNIQVFLRKERKIIKYSLISQ